MPSIEENLRRLGITLPPAPKPVASYIPFVTVGELIFISGQLPSREGRVAFQGSVPQPISLEHGQEAARLATINALAILHEACGGQWQRLGCIVRLSVFVQSQPDFYQQSTVANGASDLLLAVLGESGRHARVAVGVSALPLNSTVEVELLAAIRAA